VEVTISYPFAFLAGLVSFLSPCVLPLVPSYVTFVSGVTLEELTEDGGGHARRTAAIHSALFALGFILVFMTLGATASSLGQAFNLWLPAISKAGGVLIAVLGVFMLGVLPFPALNKEARVHLATKPAGKFGSVLVGIVFGAGWTPCIGPILASILFWAGMEQTAFEGTLLLGTYGLGLALPFWGAATGMGWFLGKVEAVRRWIVPLQRVAGILLIVVGILLVTGRFAMVSSSLADMGQWIELEMP
jgi:cytochrome c-type biogenesis protein